MVRNFCDVSNYCSQVACALHNGLGLYLTMSALDMHGLPDITPQQLMVWSGDLEDSQNTMYLHSMPECMTAHSPIHIHTQYGGALLWLPGRWSEM